MTSFDSREFNVQVVHSENVLSPVIMGLYDRNVYPDFSHCFSAFKVVIIALPTTEHKLQSFFFHGI